MSEQNEALRLADSLDSDPSDITGHKAAAELRRLHAEVEEQCRLNGMGSEREARLRTEVEALRADAERYRWLKEHCALGIKQNGAGWSLNTRQCVAPESMRDVDAAIDAAKEQT